MNAPVWVFPLVGVLVGICSGIFGIGGGVLIVPILALGFGYAQSTASGISLTAFILPIGALGVWEYWRTGRLTGDHIKVGLLLAVGLFVGAYLGAKVAGQLPEAALRKGFAVLMVGVAIRLWIS